MFDYKRAIFNKREVKCDTVKYYFSYDLEESDLDHFLAYYVEDDKIPDDVEVTLQGLCLSTIGRVQNTTNDSKLDSVVNSCIKKITNVSEEDLIKICDIYDENAKEEYDSDITIIMNSKDIYKLEMILIGSDGVIYSIELLSCVIASEMQELLAKTTKNSCI